jgi:hypothetical protein
MYLKKMGLICMGLGVGFLLLEVLLRVFSVSFSIFYQLNPHTGFSLRPGLEARYPKEGRNIIKISSAGLRDHEHSKIKPVNTFRIAVLGDSQAEAMGVPLETTFWAVMERKLNQCENFSGKQVEAVNFGVADFGTAQELMVLRHYAWDYSPDLVLLAISTSTDIRNNSRILDGLPIRPYFYYQGNELKFDDSFLQSSEYKARSTWAAKVLYDFLAYSRTLQVLREARQRLMDDQTAQRKKRLEENNEIGIDDAIREHNIFTMVYREPRDKLWQEAWKITEGLLMLMNKEVSEKNARFLVVSLSDDQQVNPDPLERERFEEKIGVKDLFYPAERIEDIGEKGGFQVLSLGKRFQEFATKSKVFLHGFGESLGIGHFNKAGHKLAGETIAEHICRDFEKLGP